MMWQTDVEFDNIIAANARNLYRHGFPDADAAGKKYDTGKLRMDLIPPEAERAMAAVLTYGAEKYGPNQWRGVSPERYEAALRRHLLAQKEGEVVDQESGLPHSWHVLCNAAFLVALDAEGKRET